MSQDAQDEKIRELVERCRGGDQEAATVLFQRYVDRLIALLRERISPRLASRMDPEDVLQSAYRSFFNGLGHGKFAIERADELWGLLAAITLHKLCRKVAYHKAKKRAVQREYQPERDQDLLKSYPDLVSELPTPSEAAELVEELDLVMQQLTPQERRILELRLEGYTSEEIADHLHRSDRTVRRAMEKVRNEFRRRLMANAAD
jgi:RNA polymerase sigma-70 factor (ECF subfamily)